MKAVHRDEKFTRRFDAEVWRKILRLLKPYRWQYAVIMGVITLLACVDVMFPLVVRYAVDEGITVKNTGAVLRAVMVYTGLIVLQTCLVSAFIAGCGRVGVRVMADLRKKMFDHLQSLSVSYFDRTPVGWIMTRMLSDSQRVGETLTWGAVDFVWGIIMMGLMACAMVVVHWKLALAVLGLLPIILLISIKFQKRILSRYREVRRINSEITARYNEGITGVKVIKAMVREDAVSREFSGEAETMYRASFHSAVLGSMYLPIIHVIGAVGSALVVGLGGRGVIAGSITLGTLVAFVSYTRRFFDPANEIARVFGQLQETQASAERLFSLLETEPEVTERADAKKTGSITGHVEFKKVTFGYDPDIPVLKDYSMTVEPGQTIALVGPTGGGKSTVISLLMRFYDPQKGGIYLDGKDIRDCSFQWLRSRMGVVLQTPHLFSGTLKDNLRYGQLDAGDDEIVTAARRVGLHEVALSLEKGYDTELKEGGEPLSTGQKQLVSLARAVLANPAVFIMDEATSCVDTETEHRIQEATEAILKGRTAFIIAHRLTTIRNADRILVIEDGRIKESGTHRELLQLHGHYYRLYTQQFMASANRI